MPVIYLIRHAQASFGEGSYDLLSPLGERQSALVGASLSARGVRPDRVVAGTLRRQRDTALGCFPSLDGHLELDARWNEYDTAGVLAVHGSLASDDSSPRTELGAPAGVSTRDFQALLDPALEAWVRAGEDSATEETWPAFQQRALGALDALSEQLGSGENGIAFTSGGVIGAIGAALLGGPGTLFVTLNRVTVNGAISKVIVGRGGPRLVTFNDHAHFESGDRELMTFR